MLMLYVHAILSMCPTLLLPSYIHMSVLYVRISISCPANTFICTIPVESTYVP